MNVSFQTAEKGGKSATDEWYTPPYIIKPLGSFDLDPATCEKAISINQSAKNYYTVEDNGLHKEWFGRVWLNPPYSNPLIKQFIKKLSDHNNGIALVSNRCASAWFQDYVLSKAHSILFLRKRISFFNEKGVLVGRPGCGSVLIAYGEQNTTSLSYSGLEGKLVELKNVSVNNPQLNFNFQIERV